MVIVDFILNIVGVLLWFHWCSLRFDPLAGTTARTLAGTLQRAEARKVRHWQAFGLLAALIVLRAWVYWQLSSAALWTAKVDVSMIVLVFRSDYFHLALLYSCLSFARVLAILYFWLIALAVINWTLEGDAVQRLIRLHLGRVAHLPRWMLVLLPCIAVGFGWISIHPLLVRAGLVAQVKSFGHLARQGLLVGTSMYFSLKYLLPTILLGYLVINHVHMGRSPLWDFVAATSHNLLRPLRAIPHKVGRLDILPLIAAVLILVLLDALPNYIEHRYPDLRRWLWPV